MLRFKWKEPELIIQVNAVEIYNLCMEMDLRSSSIIDSWEKSMTTGEENNFEQVTEGDLVNLQ